MTQQARSRSPALRPLCYISKQRPWRLLPSSTVSLQTHRTTRSTDAARSDAISLNLVTSVHHGHPLDRLSLSRSDPWTPAYSTTSAMCEADLERTQEREGAREAVKHWIEFGHCIILISPASICSYKYVAVISGAPQTTSHLVIHSQCHQIYGHSSSLCGTSRFCPLHIRLQMRESSPALTDPK
ncbi:hypothetical protein VTK56DRAFT_4964 [Thermocarpiscus australiensis]